MTTIEILERCKHGGHWRTPTTTKPDGTCLVCMPIRDRSTGRGAGRAIPTYQGLIPGTGWTKPGAGRSTSPVVCDSHK